MNARVLLSCLAWLSVLPTAALAQAVPAPAVAPSPPAAEAPRPRIGLVLSGGGARGAAHIGVLKVLEREHVRIDAIAGTSMGAIVGGLYASGMPLKDIETLFRSTDWLDAFRDRPPRASLGFRRKQDDREFLVRVPLGLKGNRFLLPRGLVQGQKLLAALRQSTLPVADVHDFDRLPIPFRALATDITTGESVPLRSGDLAEAMRASMSAPGVFSPVEIDGRLLVDGGLVANLPVDLARSMGVDRLIVVDVTFPLQPRSELTSALELSNQMLAVLVGRETARARASLAATDLIIDPPLGLMGSTDFQRVGEAIDLGEQAAQGARPALAAFRADDTEWSALQAAHARPPFPQPTVAFVALDGPRRYEKLVKGALKREVGRTLDGARVDKALSRLYGRGLFETLDWKPVKDAQGRDGLQVEARRKSWGPNYVRFGLDLQDDFEGNNSFNAGARFLVTELNAFGAEWRTDLQFGENPLLDTEYYQPLGYASPWFVAPRLRMENRNVAVLSEGVRVAEFRVREAQFGLDLGREFGNCCELRFGVQRALGSYRLRIGSRDSLPPGTFVLDANDRAEFDRGEYFARFTYDKLDSVYFPRQGSYFSASWTASRERLGAPEGSDRAEVDWLSAFSRGRHTLLLWGSAGSTVSTSPGAVDSLFQLGGFLRLSGQPEGALTGPHYAVARIVGLRKIGRGGDGFLNVPTYLGASFEAGNVWGRRGDASLGSLRKNAALFLGLDTYLGPLYLGAGFDEAGNSAYYLFLGRGF